MTRTTSPVVFGAAVRAQWELPGFSRMPFSVRVFSKEASAREIAHFVSKAARRHGRPAHFISDHARRFTGQIFRRKLKRLGVKQRFGAVGEEGFDRLDREALEDAEGHAPGRVPRCGAAAAGSRSKSSLNEGHSRERRRSRCARMEVSRRAGRWSVRANARCNSHCAPTKEERKGHRSESAAL